MTSEVLRFVALRRRDYPAISDRKGEVSPTDLVTLAFAFAAESICRYRRHKRGFDMTLFTLITMASPAFGGVAGPMPMPVHIAQAAQGVVDCSQVVDDILLKTDGRLLSVRPHPDRCTVTVLVVSEGQRPERKVFRVAIDAGKGTTK